MPHEATRIVLVNLPRMLREIIEEIVSHEHDMEVVGEFSKTVGLLEAVDSTDADFLITGTGDSELVGVGQLLRERPRIKVLAVGADGRQTCLYELRPQKVRLGEISPQTLLEAIRAAVRDDVFEAVT